MTESPKKSVKLCLSIVTTLDLDLKKYNNT